MVHHAAADGYPVTADNYVKGRPDYAPELVDWLRGFIGLGPGKTVIDLGAGTGKFTPRLVATGARVIAVEPVAEMRAILVKAVENVVAMEGTAEAIPLADASVDAVVCAQSFHWFATRAALAEMHRVLKPGGKLGLVWNMRDARVGWVAKLDDIVNRYEGDTPRYYTGKWRAAFPFEGFEPLHEEHFSIGHTGSPEDVIVRRVKSSSFIAVLSDADKAEVERKVRALIDAEPELRGRSELTVPYETAAFSTTKR